MPAVFVSGDLFTTRRSTRSRMAATAGAMRRGIAVEFRRRFPRMYAEYKQRCAAGRFALGDVFAWREGERVVFNLGAGWRTNAELGAIETASRAMVHLAEQDELGRIRRIGRPRIGAGLGGQL
jgi:hypothetical protein